MTSICISLDCNCLPALFCPPALLPFLLSSALLSFCSLLPALLLPALIEKTMWYSNRYTIKQINNHLHFKIYTFVNRQPLAIFIPLPFFISPTIPSIMQSWFHYIQNEYPHQIGTILCIIMPHYISISIVRVV